MYVLFLYHLRFKRNRADNVGRTDPNLVQNNNIINVYYTNSWVFYSFPRLFGRKMVYIICFQKIKTSATIYHCLNLLELDYGQDMLKLLFKVRGHVNYMKNSEFRCYQFGWFKPSPMYGDVCDWRVWARYDLKDLDLTGLVREQNQMELRYDCKSASHSSRI